MILDGNPCPGQKALPRHLQGSSASQIPVREAARAQECENLAVALPCRGTQMRALGTDFSTWGRPLAAAAAAVPCHQDRSATVGVP
jgi:hypothetical protein